ITISTIRHAANSQSTGLVQSSLPRVPSMDAVMVMWLSIRIFVGHSGARRRRELRCAIAHRRISRFRVWSFGPSRNDSGERCDANLHLEQLGIARLDLVRHRLDACGVFL